MNQRLINGSSIVLFGSLLALVLFRPIAMTVDSLDGAWVRVLEYAFLNHLKVGEEIAFTFGPLGISYVNLFHPDTINVILLVQILVILAWLIYFSTRINWRQVVLILVLVVMASMIHELVYLGLSILGLWAARDKTRWVYGLVWWVVGVTAAIKFTFLVTGFALLLVADLINLLVLKRRTPVAFLTFVGGLIFAFLLAAQPLSSILDYLYWSWEISGGYSEAMSVYGDTQELLMYMLLMSVFYLCFTLNYQHRDEDFSWRLHILHCMGISFFLFFLTKSGFVRHDWHSLTGWVGLSFLGFFFWSEFRDRRVHQLCFLMIGLYAMTIGLLQKQSFIPKQVQINTLGLAWVHLEDNLSNISGLFTGRFFEKFSQKRAEHDAALLTAYGPLSENSYDLLPYDVSVLTLAPQQYQPRPVFQGYSAYTAKLISKNLKAFRSHRPEALIHQAYSIDNRWPALDDGAFISEILGFYDPWGARDNGFEYHLRTQPREFERTDHEVKRIELGQWLEFDAANRFLFARIEFPSSWVRQLQTALYRAPVFYIEARLVGGQVVRHRIISSMSSSEFLLSPYLFGNQLMQFFPGVGVIENTSYVVEAIRISAEHTWPGDHISEVTVNLDSRIYADETEATYQPSKHDQFLDQLSRSAQYKHTHFPKRHGDDGLRTHSDMRLYLPVSSLNEIRFDIGMVDVSWERGNTDGVLFRLSLVQEGQTRLLLERDLDPLARSEDRGRQPIQHQFKEVTNGVLEFEFLQKQNANFDWSYLAAIELATTEAAVITTIESQE